jgi:hypothetical protein
MPCVRDPALYSKQQFYTHTTKRQHRQCFQRSSKVRLKLITHIERLEILVFATLNLCPNPRMPERQLDRLITCDVLIDLTAYSLRLHGPVKLQMHEEMILRKLWVRTGSHMFAQVWQISTLPEPRTGP